MKAYAPLLLAGVALNPLSALAGPADYVFTPAVEYGEKEIDFKAGTARKGDSPSETAASIGFGYGAKEWWFTEVYVKYKREDGQGTKYDAIEWENKFQITDTGKYPVDIGFIVELERPRNRAEGWEVMWGPLFQTELSKFQFNANLLFERSYRVEDRSDMHFLYQWQTKYRWRPEFEFGLQGFGDMGKWNHWATKDERSHTAGPAVFGKIPMGNHQAIKYNAAWLVGTSSAATDRNLRIQVEYEF